MTTRTVIVAGLVFMFAFGAAATPRIFVSGIDGDVSEALQTAQRQFSAGDYSAAIRTLQSVVVQSPTSADAFFWLGRSYYELHNYNNAIPQLEKSTQLDSSNSEYHHRLGNCIRCKSGPRAEFFPGEEGKEGVSDCSAVRSIEHPSAARFDGVLC